MQFKDKSRNAHNSWNNTIPDGGVAPRTAQLVEIKLCHKKRFKGTKEYLKVFQREDGWPYAVQVRINADLCAYDTKVSTFCAKNLQNFSLFTFSHFQTITLSQFYYFTSFHFHNFTLSLFNTFTPKSCQKFPT